MPKTENFNELNFGNLITNFRKNLNLTQEEFGSLILTSRITTIKIEKIKNVIELSDDLLLRINYLTARLASSEKFDESVKLMATNIYNITSKTLAERITNNITSPVLKLIINH